MMTMPRVHAVIAARHRAWQTPRNERTGNRNFRATSAIVRPFELLQIDSGVP
jgi:hypothetical protein